MKQWSKQFVLYLIGGALYVLFELIWRGYSHWTMFVLGGICFLLIGAINEFIPWDMPVWKQVLIGVTVITSLEFITGCVVNLWLGWNVWDYSDVLFNLFGQICLPYMLLWVPISLLAIVLDDYLRYWLFDEEKPHYHIWKVGCRK